MKILTRLLVSAVAAITLSTNPASALTLTAPTTPLVDEIPAKKESFYPEDLLRAVFCESQFHQTDSRGELLVGRQAKVGEDIGIAQINTYYHKERAEKLGLHLERLRDNLDYAALLFKENNLTPWKWSFDPTTDKCKNQVYLPPRKSSEWSADLLFLRTSLGKN